METAKTSNFTCQSKSFISIFFTFQVSACELQPFSCRDLANDRNSQPAKTVFSHLKISCFFGSSNWTNWLLNSNGGVATLGDFNCQRIDRSLITDSRFASRLSLLVSQSVIPFLVCLSIPVQINLLKCGYKSENLSCLGHKRVIEISGKIDLKTTLKTPLSTDFKPFISTLIKFNCDCPYTLCKQKLILYFYDPSRWKPTVNL